MFDNLATMFAPAAGAVVKFKVVPDIVKSSTGANFLPDFLTDNKWTSAGVDDNVNPAVEPSPVKVLVDDTKIAGIKRKAKKLMLERKIYV